MSLTLLDTLSGQVTLVTGANRGIGAAIAAEMAELDAHVYAGTRDPDRFEVQDGVVPIEIDVTDDSAIDAAIERIEHDAGRLDVLVNNAGIASGGWGTLLETPLDAIDDVLAVNLRGAIVLTKLALPLLLQRAGARVVNVSSGMGAMSEGMRGGAPAYRISKAGLNALTVYLHGEFGADGLIANAACPGWVRTDMGGAHAPRSVEEGAATPVWLSRFAPGSPGGQFWRDRRVIEW